VSLSSNEEIDIIARVLSNNNSGNADQLEEVLEMSLDKYVDEDRFKKEQQILFKEFPIVVGHVSQVAESGDFFTHDATGVPILVTRNRDGVVQAFLNVCRHRGAKIENKPCGKSGTFSCPYHGWTYDFNGNLRGIPQGNKFGEVDKNDLGLVPIQVFVRFGLIWVIPSPKKSAVDIDAWLAPMAEQFESLNLQDHVIYQAWTVNSDMNWHILIEGFQEQYHFCHAHRESACSYYLDTQGIYINKYPHVRHAVPMSQIVDLEQLPQEEWSYRKNFMTQNYIFPANFMQVMSDHVYIHTILPNGIDKSIFTCMMLIPEAPATEKAEKYWKANYDVLRVVFNEDFTIGESIQKGFASQANDFFTIGRCENTIQFAQQSVKDALEGRLKA
jgi:phenylpropionate dioxygenase-like ring-hydroxylating dioxygenase large terminal subunit